MFRIFFRNTFHSLLHLLVIKRATAQDIERILKSENITHSEQSIALLLKGDRKGTRYGTTVSTQSYEGKDRAIFLKIQLDGKMKTFRPFQRQIKVTEILQKDPNFKSPLIKVLKYSLTSPVAYALFETREDGTDFGFMHDDSESYQKVTESEMTALVDTIYSFNVAGKNIDPTIWKYTEKMPSHLLFFKKEMLEWLNIKITHKTESGETLEKTVEDLLETNFQIPHIRQRVMEILEKNWAYVAASQKENKNYLVHGDMQIDNIYKNKNGTFELLDFEWVNQTNSPILAIMRDYGNLRARAWSSTKFQADLDKAFIEVGKKYFSDPEIVRAGMTLGLLRSSLMIVRFHLDYKNTVKKDRRTEEDYFRMFPLTLASLKSALR